jgi:hypothetical protein
LNHLRILFFLAFAFDLLIAIDKQVYRIRTLKKI